MADQENNNPNIPRTADEYINIYRAAVAKNPECGTSRYNLAIGLIGKQLYEEAEQQLYAAIENSPSLAEAYVQLGGLCLARGDLDGCQDWNQRAIKARAGFSEGYGNLGFVHMQKGEPEKAEWYLKKAIAYNAHFIQAFVTLATAYYAQGLVDESIAACEKALSLDETFAVAHNNLAIAYVDKGDYEKAIKHADLAREYGFDVPEGLMKDLEPHRK
ncbi:MAG: tetratricopeptide repeat protein [Desulfatibacillaceae bacterium]